MEIDTQYMNDMLKYREQNADYFMIDGNRITNDFNNENHLYKPSGNCDCEEEMELINFDRQKTQNKFLIRILRKGRIALIDELPNEYLCELWLEQLKEDNFDFDDYDIKQGILMEGGGYWW